MDLFSSDLWLMKIGSSTYPGLKLETLQEWAREGRISPSAMIYRPGSSVGQLASDVSELRDAMKSSPAPFVCRICGHRGSPEIRSKANGCVAVALLFFLLIPGIIYLVWASTTEPDRICPNCKGVNTMIPSTSPLAG